MINVNDFRTGVTIMFDGNIYQVLEFQHVKPGKGPAFVRSKLKNLRTGAIIDHTFTAGIKVETAHVEKTTMQYLYSMGDTYYFMNMETYEQLEIKKDLISNAIDYLKEGLEVEIVTFEGQILDVILPDKIALKVTKTETAVRGNTTSNAYKDAELETGLVVKVPLFIDQDEVILVSTKDGKYVSRA
ncbi:MAG: elongation factor P [Bacilli bacterium]